MRKQIYIDPDKFIGLTKEEGEALATKHRYYFRVLKGTGMGQDLCDERLNVYIKDGKISRAYIG